VAAVDEVLELVSLHDVGRKDFDGDSRIIRLVHGSIRHELCIGSGQDTVEEALDCGNVGGGRINVSWVLERLPRCVGTWRIVRLQGIVADKVHVSVPDVVCGRLSWANFVGGGLDPVGSVRAGADFFVFKGSAGGWIDDGVGAMDR
jgi:hypothetical protein